MINTRHLELTKISGKKDRTLLLIFYLLIIKYHWCGIVYMCMYNVLITMYSAGHCILMLYLYFVCISCIVNFVYIYAYIIIQYKNNIMLQVYSMFKISAQTITYNIQHLYPPPFNHAYIN